MMKAPSKTKLMVIKSYIDMALSNPEDWYGAIQLMQRIETEIRELYPREERLEIERRLRGEKESPASDDPETQGLIAAAKQWREEQGMIEDREVQDDHANAALSVARSASFAVCQESVKQKTKTREDNA